MTTGRYLVSAWSLSPAVIGVCVSAAAAYAFALRFRFSARAGFFFGGLALLFLCLTSPLDALADGVLFSAHMTQHLLLLLIVPLLVVVGLPTRAPRERIGKGRSRLGALLGWGGGVGAMWAWHERTLCDLATRTEGVRVIQIVSLLVLGTLFWWPLAGPVLEHRLPPLTGVVYLLGACIACSVLGILITFSPGGAVCPIYLEAAGQPDVQRMIRDQWGITGAKDQELGGLIMWLPGCGIYLTGVMAMLARWYAGAEVGNPAASPRPALEGHSLSPAPRGPR
jgi:cytochrome c oxidase assembly factor CtaG